MIAIAIALWAALAIALAFIYYVRYVEPMRIGLTRVEVPLEGLPEALENLTIAHLSDFHLRPTRTSERICRQAIEVASRTDADLVVITGDLTDGYDLLDLCVARLVGLSAPLGVWAVLGNHDDYCYGESVVRAPEPPTEDERRVALGSLGIRLLVNETTLLGLGDVVVALVGIGDISAGRDDLPRALEGAKASDLVILLSHSPDILDEPEVEAADLVLCGHTHGGQLTLPGIGSPWAPVWRDRRRSAGLMRAGRQMCYVTRGVASATQARFRCAPEVALLVLRRGAPEGVRAVPVRRGTLRVEPEVAAAEEVIS